MTIPSPFNLEIIDPHSKGSWYFKLTGQPNVNWFTQDQFGIVLNAEGRKIGDFDEQRTWSGGRGGERFSDDPTKYKDAREACTWIDGHLFPSLQWQISSGYRDVEMSLVGSKSWRGLFGTTQSISRTISASATSNRRKVWLWIRRVGSPGTLTVELRDNSGGSPGSVLKTVDVTTSTVTDRLSVLQEFDYGSNQAVTSGTTYHIVACGADTDNDKNHWEVAVDTSGSSSKYSASGAADAGSWTTAAFSMYYRLTDPEISRRWWFFIYASNTHAVSDESTTSLYKWNESTDLWEVVTGHGLTGVTGRPIEVNGILYFPRGDSTAIRTYNGTNWDDQTIATGQGCATGLAVGYSQADGKVQIWRYNNALVSGGTTTGLAVSVSRADGVAAYNTDLAFRNSILVGSNGTSITGIDAVNNTLWVRKSNEIGTVDNDRYTELNFGVKKTPSSDNGIAFLSWQGLIYWNWLFSTQRFYSGTVDDIGEGFKSNSFPFGREGVDAAYTTYIQHMFTAKDAGASGTSSVMLYDSLQWHEFARSWYSGRRIRDVFVQPVSGGRNRLWYDCGGDMVFVELPLNKGNPLDDTAAKYMHEFEIISTEIDMGTASKLPKFIKDMTLTSKNLNSAGIYVDFEYQLDDDVGGSTWVNKELKFTTSPEDVVQINEGNIRKLAYRMIGHTDNQLVPPDIRGIVPNGFSRSPMRRILECQATVSDVTVNGRKQGAQETMDWLEEASQGTYFVHMKSRYRPLNDYYAILAPANVYPIRTDPQTNTVTFSLMVL
jgi:hypothetical protein